MIYKKNKEIQRYLSTWIHFKKRLFERYGITMEENEYKALCKGIKNGKIKIYPIIAENGSGNSFGVVIHNAVVNVVFDAKEGHLVTALPKQKDKRVYN